ncbi:MAG: phosphoenolpyruvate carboxykinase, partial [candidate division NC10 bacterium]|nr:phosphoenolpyruvate carboxykinase [candidate division NC10 bacterium]
MTENAAARQWVSEVAALCRPAGVVWCDGSAAERERFQEEAVKRGDLIPLNQRALPGCTLHRSDPTDVARTEHLTFICSREEADAGPTNNWMSPAKAYERLSKILAGSMAGRTMYVIPFLLGPPGSPFGKVGIQVTDSLYVVLNMGIMTRMGRIALEQLGGSASFTRGLHSTADLNVERRFICHFPEDNTIWSVGSGYG